jgi:hypothetical protein
MVKQHRVKTSKSRVKKPRKSRVKKTKKNMRRYRKGGADASSTAAATRTQAIAQGKKTRKAEKFALGFDKLGPDLQRKIGIDYKQSIRADRIKAEEKKARDDQFAGILDASRAQGKRLAEEHVAALKQKNNKGIKETIRGLFSRM